MTLGWNIILLRICEKQTGIYFVKCIFLAIEESHLNAVTQQISTCELFFIKRSIYFVICTFGCATW